MSKPKQPAQIGINAKMLAEILNAIKDYGDNKRVLITLDADNAAHPVFIETPDGSAKQCFAPVKLSKGVKND